MHTREPLHPELIISKRLERFRQPPCQPSKGQEVLERYFDVLHSQPSNCCDVNGAARAVAKELHELWEKGDARIPINKVQTIQRKILEFREDLRYLLNKSKKGRPAYAEKVSLTEITSQSMRDSYKKDKRGAGGGHQIHLPPSIEYVHRIRRTRLGTDSRVYGHVTHSIEWRLLLIAERVISDDSLKRCDYGSASETV